MKRSIPRRSFLKAAGLTVALPLLESQQTLAGTLGDATPTTSRTSGRAKRLVFVGTYLGFYQKAFFPKQTGFNYESSELLKPIEHFRDEFSVFSGLDHRANNGHKNWSTYLTGKRLGAISIDQIVAKQIGHQTRFESIQLSTGKVKRPMNFTRLGIPLPMIGRPSVLYKKLFASPEDQKRVDYLLESGQSALDKVIEEAKQLQRRVNTGDRRKLDEYFTAVREVERRVHKQRAGLDTPIPSVDYKLPEFDPIAPTLMLECEEIMYDLMALALQTDSTRVMTFNIGGLGQVFTLDGRTLRAGYHSLSHHGNDPEKIRDLVRVEQEHIKCLARFLKQLKEKTDDQNRPLLDSTLVVLGTGMGDSSRHSNQNLPILVAGGGLKHGQHIAIDRENTHSSTPLLGDLYLTLMQQMGLEVDTFSNAKRNMNEYLM